MQLAFRISSILISVVYLSSSENFKNRNKFVSLFLWKFSSESKKKNFNKRDDEAHDKEDDEEDDKEDDEKDDKEDDEEDDDINEKREHDYEKEEDRKKSTTMKLRIIILCTTMFVLISFVLANDDDTEGEQLENGSQVTTSGQQIHHEESDRKRKAHKNNFHNVYMALMLAKSMISTILMFISPIIQMKSFGLSVINTVINIARFILQVKGSLPPADPLPAPISYIAGAFAGHSPPTAELVHAYKRADIGKYPYFNVNQLPLTGFQKKYSTVGAFSAPTNIGTVQKTETKDYSNYPYAYSQTGPEQYQYEKDVNWTEMKEKKSETDVYNSNWYKNEASNSPKLIGYSY